MLGKCSFLYSFLLSCVLPRPCILLSISCIFHNNTHNKLQSFHGVMATSILNTETQPLLPASAPVQESTVPDHQEESRSIPLGFLIVAIAGNSPQKLIGQSNTSAYNDLLTGVFLANADTSLVVATHGSIALEFNSFSSSPWLLTGYTLGYSVALPAVRYIHVLRLI